MEFASNDYRKAVTYTDAAAKRIEKLESVVHKATRPDDIWTPDYQILGTNPWHCDLAPAIAADRWEKVAELDQLCYDLEERWYELESEAEDTRKNAAKAHADALRKGTKTPATATKSLEAYAALEGCSLALTETANELRRARGTYEALLKDRAFLNEYRTAVIAEFNARRKQAAEAFSAAAGAINATRSRYSTLHTLTMGGLLDIPEDAQGYLVLHGKGWGQADLSSAVDVISRQVNETDPFLSGEFLTASMDEISAKAVETAEEIKAQLYPDRQNYLAQIGGVMNTGLGVASSYK
ncbi:hypothetical protein [Streptomyces sp. NPDC018000]|uniref:hypothetical protein n=1 Tax=Streptomyces sp. NPDC018000 TaxID=3365028 RepID=UPI0037898612